ncbi:ADP-ribosyl cyclase/cyclic ADP-ribose hydrolase 2-like isoform X2 [Pleurodeles waltl]|uniref:ADP-ribosyl cyclase/cyclic ADP-ribose hydrolase 2-like isoform X2 n=1 Tax=Pleurodeles waltl TaxID=8319 RepID=UPI0037099B23
MPPQAPPWRRRKREKNCLQIWEAFQLAFVNKDPCSVLPSDYELYINLTLHKIPPNKSLFWENNKLLVHRYADKAQRFVPLGDSLMGWIADDLDWCGQTNYPGVDYISCPTTSECENNAKESFWRIASVTYAKISSGIIYIMLNGSSPGGAFPNESFFADYELPNFQSAQVSRFEIWVNDEIEGPDLDSCGTGSLKSLGSLLDSRGYTHSCTDNYRPVQLIQCVDFPSDHQCAIRSSSSIIDPSSPIFLQFVILFVSFGQIHLLSSM